MKWNTNGGANPVTLMIERRTWIVTVWLGVLAAFWVGTIALGAYVASSMRDVGLILDANHRATVVNAAMGEAERLRGAGKSISVIGPAIVQKINANHDVNAAVVDDSGKLIAGDKAALSGVAIPIFPRPPKGIPFPKPRAFPGTLPPGGFGYGMEPGDRGFGPMQIMGTGLGSNVTMARLSGGWLVVQQRANVMGNLGSLYWPMVAILATLSFLTVWSVGRRVLLQSVRPMVRVERGLRRLVDVNNSTVEAIASDDAGLAAPLVESYNAAALELAAVLKQSSELESRIRQFVADAGHELRTPLAVIMGYVQLLRARSDVDSQMAERVFSEIDDQGQRMTLLIQKLLLLTRLESQEPRDVKVLDATAMVHSIADSFRPLAPDSKIAMSGETDVLVKVSESELRDSVGNLIDNAIKYAPGSKIDVTVRDRDGFVYITISDDGPGMSPELRARAFERFSRGETAGSIPGSGLGLAIVETAVQRAGGAVSLRTAHGQGTSVEMRLPAWRGNGPAHS